MSGNATTVVSDAAERSAEAPSRERTVREVVVFLGLTLALSAVFYAYLFRTGRWSSRIAHLFMWCPGLSALATRLLFARTLRGLGSERRRSRLLVVCPPARRACGHHAAS